MPVIGELEDLMTRDIDLEKQSIVLDGPEHIHVSSQCDHDNKRYIIDSLYDDATTYYECLLRGERVSNDGRCLGWRPSGNDPYQWLKYSEVRKKAQCFGSALIAKGFAPSSESKIGIFSQNRPEWVIADLGCLTFSMVTVPMYNTLGPEGRHHIMKLTDMELIVLDEHEKLNDILEHIGEYPTLKYIVVMERSIPPEVKGHAKSAGVELLLFTEFIQLGEANLKDPIPPKPDDLSAIFFTSGTTGVPKGVALTHRNFISNMAAFTISIQKTFSFPVGCTSISFLPAAHAYEHSLQCVLLMHGGASGFFRGKTENLFDDMKELKPDIFPCVPRLANIIYDLTMGDINSSSSLRDKLFTVAYDYKKKELEQGIFRRDAWSDFVFQKERGDFGGNVKVILTGSAPLAHEVMSFLQIVFGCPVVEGYGQTEAAAVITCTLPGEMQHSHVGAPIPCNMVKLVDVEEMGYLAAQGRGEVCAKGANIFSGYYKNPEKTAEALDQDGWLHTGDIGEWLPNGTLRIIDRKKHIYKLSQGEWVAPEKVENVLTRSILVAQAFVYGEALRSANVAIIVPDETEIRKFAESNGLTRDVAELCKLEAVIQAVKEDMEKVCNKAKLCGFEKVKAFTLHPELFSIDNKLLTPTMKNKRDAIKARFIDQINVMYERLSK